MTRALVIGAGVGGLCAAATLQERGLATTLVERTAKLGDGSASWIAGGMLAPCCEGESAPEEVVQLGANALDWWEAHGAEVSRTGTLVVASPRNSAEIDRFAARTRGHERIDEEGIAALEPELAGQFRRGLFFRDEGHLDPRAALRALLGRFESPWRSGVFWDGECRRLRWASRRRRLPRRAARDALPELRPVRGEMLILRAEDVRLRRCVRFLHPRIPLYVVPRGGDEFMIGATMIESADRAPSPCARRSRCSARPMLFIRPSARRKSSR